MIGLTSLWIKGRPTVSAEFSPRRAAFVLGKIDEILSWEKTKEQEKDARFVELGEYLCEGKAVELVKVARKDGEDFDCATWLHKAKELPKEGFKGEVEHHLTGKEREPWEIIYFKLYKSQVPVVEQALETAALMLGSDKSRGYCLEMICADFLAGANVGETPR